MEDAAAVAENASIAVTKRLTSQEEGIIAGNQTFYVALYEDEACTTRISDIKTIEFNNTSVSTVTFTGLEVGRTYYVGECNANGVSQTSGMLADGTIYVASFDNGNRAVVEEAGGSVTVYLENTFYTIPDGYYREGQLTITKRVLGSSGNAVNSNEVFYAGIFADAEYTTLSDQVSENIVALNMAGGSQSSVSVQVGITEGTEQTLYVTEVDRDGTPVENAPDFMYSVSIDNAAVTLTTEETSAAVTITNTEIEEEIETEIESDAEGGSSSSSTTSSSVKTGDETPIGMYLALMAGAVVVILAGTICRKRRRQ